MMIKHIIIREENGTMLRNYLEEKIDMGLVSRYELRRRITKNIIVPNVLVYLITTPSQKIWRRVLWPEIKRIMEVT